MKRTSILLIMRKLALLNRYFARDRSRKQVLNTFRMQVTQRRTECCVNVSITIASSAQRKRILSVPVLLIMTISQASLGVHASLGEQNFYTKPLEVPVRSA